VSKILFFLTTWILSSSNCNKTRFRPGCVPLTPLGERRRLLSHLRRGTPLPHFPPLDAIGVLITCIHDIRTWQPWVTCVNCNKSWRHFWIFQSPGLKTILHCNGRWIVSYCFYSRADFLAFSPRRSNMLPQSMWNLASYLKQSGNMAYLVQLRSQQF